MNGTGTATSPAPGVQGSVWSHRHADTVGSRSSIIVTAAVRFARTFVRCVTKSFVPSRLTATPVASMNGSVTSRRTRSNGRSTSITVTSLPAATYSARSFGATAIARGFELVDHVNATIAVCKSTTLTSFVA